MYRRTLVIVATKYTDLGSCSEVMTKHSTKYKNIFFGISMHCLDPLVALWRVNTKPKAGKSWPYTSSVCMKHFDSHPYEEFRNESWAYSSDVMFVQRSLTLSNHMQMHIKCLHETFGSPILWRMWKQIHRSCGIFSCEASSTFSSSSSLRDS
jgi:hypothetical protein